MRLPARKEGLLWEAVGNEIVVLDPSAHRAHRLNQSAATVWRYCDGYNTISDISRLTQQELRLSESADELVSFVVAQIQEKGILVDKKKKRPAAAPDLATRRTVVRKAATALAVLPVIATITVPQPAHAQSRRRGDWRLRFRQP